VVYDARERHEHLRTRMRAVNHVPIVYRRGALTAETTATVYELTPEILAAYGVALESRIRDYVIDVEPLKLAGLGSPAEGDEIDELDKETSTALVVKCQVIPLNGVAPFRYTSARRTAVRVHSQVIPPRTHG
jgi:hypothetical protein